METTNPEPSPFHSPHTSDGTPEPPELRTAPPATSALPQRLELAQRLVCLAEEEDPEAGAGPDLDRAVQEERAPAIPGELAAAPWRESHFDHLYLYLNAAPSERPGQCEREFGPTFGPLTSAIYFHHLH